MPRKRIYLIAALIFISFATGAENKKLFPSSGIPEQEQRILFSAAGPIHLGDEAFPGWSWLYGNCFEFEIYVARPIQGLTLILQTFGLEINAPVYLNYHKAAVLPRQAIIQSTMPKPNEWSKDRILVLATDKLRIGLNRITIFTDLVPRPQFSGDLDDFQIRNLRIISK